MTGCVSRRPGAGAELWNLKSEISGAAMGDLFESPGPWIDFGAVCSEKVELIEGCNARRRTNKSECLQEYVVTEQAIIVCVV